MNPSRETRHELYDFLQSIGLQIDGVHKGKIREFMIKHSDQLVAELKQELSNTQNSLRKKNEQITAMMKSGGHFRGYTPKQVKKVEPVPTPAQKDEPVSSFTIPKEFRGTDSKPVKRRI